MRTQAYRMALANGTSQADVLSQQASAFDMRAAVESGDRRQMDLVLAESDHGVRESYRKL
jgi:hypothetical protein